MRARGNPGEWVTTNDYPAISLRNLEEGIVRFRLDIDRSGNVSNCTVTNSSGFSALDAQTCQLISQRALFSPARNDAGKPVEGTYSNTVRWVIPAGSTEENPPLEPTAVELEFMVSSDGSIKSCRVVEFRYGDSDKPVETCPSTFLNERFTPLAETKERRVRIRFVIEISEVE